MPKRTYETRYMTRMLPWLPASIATFSAGSTTLGYFTNTRKYGIAATKAAAR